MAAAASVPGGTADAAAAAVFGVEGGVGTDALAELERRRTPALAAGAARALAARTFDAAATTVQRVTRRVHARPVAFDEGRRADAHSVDATSATRAAKAATTAIIGVVLDIDTCSRALREGRRTARGARTSGANVVRGTAVAAKAAVIRVARKRDTDAAAGLLTARADAKTRVARKALAACSAAATTIDGIRRRVDAGAGARKLPCRARCDARAVRAQASQAADDGALPTVDGIRACVDTGVTADRLAGRTAARAAEASSFRSAHVSAAAAVRGIAFWIDAGPIASDQARTAVRTARASRGACSAGSSVRTRATRTVSASAGASVPRNDRRASDPARGESASVAART
jgi:hypothetical protein